MGERVGALGPLRAPQALAAGHRRFFLDMRLRQLGDEAAGERAGPLAVDAAVGGVEDGRAAPGAGDRDVGEAAFLLEAGEAAFVQRALRREHAFLPAGQIDGVELEALGGVDGHDGDLLALSALVIVHDQADMLEEGAEVSYSSIARASSARFSRRPAAFGGAVGLEHGGVAALVEHDAGELGVGQLGRHLPPAGDVGDEAAEAAAGLRASVRRCRACVAAASSSGCCVARAWRWMVATALSPRPRLGLLTIRSNARSSAGWTIRRR